MSEPVPEHRPVIATPDVINAILTGEVSDQAEVTYDDGGAVHARLQTVTEQLPQVGPVSLTVDYVHFRQRDAGEADHILLQYEHGDEHIAELEFEFPADGTVMMRHRYVQPAYRGHRIGDRLLQQSETIFQALANRRKQPVEVWEEVGQRKVLAWLLRNGYTARDEQSRVLIEQVQTHPEQFVFADVNGALVRDEGIFAPTTTGRSSHDLVMMQVHKILQPPQNPSH
ncbi:MAG: hypothetical protein HY565_03100 [Candidatus Kerfeldbacteria bacterium]|nr:hypothetical protein [Candidatus Kerfeldbacteria bacterium]